MGGVSIWLRVGLVVVAVGVGMMVAEGEERGGMVAVPVVLVVEGAGMEIFLGEDTATQETIAALVVREEGIAVEVMPPKD